MSALGAAVTEPFEHEQVAFCHHAESGLRAIIAIHSTVLGPALGGTRYYPYASTDLALADVLRLARGMTYKAACAGVELGGGKAVIIGDPRVDKSREALTAYGRFVESLGGRYVTACDVGTYPADMDVIASQSGHVAGTSAEAGGSGDTSFLTAYGVLQGMRAAAERRWDSASLVGRRVGVAGAGKVGRNLVDLLVEEGAVVVVADVDPEAVAAVRAIHPHVEVAAADQLTGAQLDVYAPCAMGGALTPATAAAIEAEIVCGAANNQLASPEVDRVLQERGVLCAPDYVVNAGGLIQAFDETLGYDADRARKRTEMIYDTTHRIFDLADAERLTPSAAADRFAELRIGSHQSEVQLPRLPIPA